jgi:hypothetical protein
MHLRAQIICKPTVAGGGQMAKMKAGELVLARTFGGTEVERRVWEDAGGEVVYLCSERQYEALTSGWEAPMPIGFPREDVRPPNFRGRNSR